MNKGRRACLQKARDAIEEVKNDEEDCLAGLPANLQDGTQVERMQEAIDALEECLSALDGVLS